MCRCPGVVVCDCLVVSSHSTPHYYPLILWLFFIVGFESSPAPWLLCGLSVETRMKGVWHSVAFDTLPEIRGG